jgi:signal peptidase I
VVGSGRSGIVGVVLRALLWLLAGLLVWTVAAGVVAGALGYRFSPVLSGSMRPTFAPGDAVVTRPVSVGSLHRGMVIEFTPPGESAPFAHRIIRLSGDPHRPTIMTKGDANPVPDSWHLRLTGAAVPEVVGVVPDGGWLLIDLHHSSSTPTVMILVGLLITFYGAKSLVKAYRQPSVPEAPVTASA